MASSRFVESLSIATGSADRRLPTVFSSSAEISVRISARSVIANPRSSARREMSVNTRSEEREIRERVKGETIE